MATHNLAQSMADQGPIIPDEDLERLLAEMFGRRRGAPRPVQPTAPPSIATVAPPVQVAPGPAAFEPFEVPALEVGQRSTADVAVEAPAVEPLHLPKPRRKRGRWLAIVALPILALGAGWWASGMQPPAEIASLLQRASLLSEPSAPRTPPIIAAPPPNAVRAAPADASAPAPTTDAPAPAPVAPAPRPIQAATPVQPPVDGAGVLGKPEVGPFDQVTPRSVRTTAVLPPPPEAETANAAPKPLDFDDPATWPAGAEKADPHPLPPRRR